MSRKDFDVSHSRPHKATVPGTPPNSGVKRNLHKKASYGAMLLAKATHRRQNRPACVLTGIPEEINTLVMTADINTALQIWDPFHDTVNTRAKTIKMGR